MNFGRAWPGLVVILLVFVSAQAQDTTYFAQERFSRAKSLYIEGRYPEALEGFRESLAVYASPNTRLYVARTLRALSRGAEAAMELERTWREAHEQAPRDPRYLETERAAQKELAALIPRLGTLVVSLPQPPPPGATLTVDGVVVPRPLDGERVPVAPGAPRLIAKAPGYALFTRVVSVQARGSGTATVVWTPLPPPPDSRETLRAVGIPLAVVGALGSATLSVLADREYHALERLCRGGPCPASQSVAILRGKREQTFAFSSLGLVGVGGILIGLSFVLPKPQLALTLGSTGVGVGGAFGP